ncbi:unnamed protein product [Parnassius mnemosyne]|uniref:Serpin domain-containing protein n=1 Tax=Parnassius mnemosyne TaxID=213953 RepID=A0AAV1LXG9_9NEOP
MILDFIKSLIMIYFSLSSCVWSQTFKLNRKYVKTSKYHSESSLSALNFTIRCNFLDFGCFFTPFPRRSNSKSTKGYFHKKIKRQLNLMSHYYVTPALDMNKWPQSVVHGKLIGEKLKVIPNSYKNNQNLSISINSIIANNAHGPLISISPVNKKLLQSINNPSIYKVTVKPMTEFYVPTKSTNIHQFTRRTNSPITIPEPYFYINETKTIPKSVDTSQIQNLQWNSNNMDSNYDVMPKFMQALDQLERKFYKVTFTKLSQISPVNRRENGISFVQSGLFLQLTLMALSSEVDHATRQEIEDCIGLQLSDTEMIYTFNEIVSSLPKSSDALKFRFSTRLTLDVKPNLQPQFEHGIANALQLHLNRINRTDTAEVLRRILNKMIEEDSGGAMQETFAEDELSEAICSVLLTTMYIRPRWRSAPTVLNGTHIFHDAVDAPHRSARMIRINDIMQYAELNEWDAEAIEINYATPGLSLLILVPRGRSLRNLAAHLAETSIHHVLERMYTLRVAVTLPLYTLRMTLLLPSKLQSMGISRLVDLGNGECEELRLSHAVQRLMFWAEAGRNAFKDDGMEWDETPELELVVNRPYIFYVRWRNITIMNGNFVL